MNNARTDGLRIRVAHVGPSRASRGGMAAVTRDLAASPLAERYGFDFVDTWRGEAGRLLRLADFALGLMRLAVWCLRPGARVVHVHTAVRGSWYRKGIVVGLVLALRRPVILQVHSGAGDITAFWNRLGPLRRRAVRSAFAHADQVISVSEAGAGALRALLALDHVLVVRNAAPQPRPRPPAAAVAAARDHVEILYLGGFANPAKGGAVLLEALPAILDGGGVSVALAGPGEPPAALASLAGDCARWLGWLDEDAKADALARADMVLFPSISEGLPIALLEAMVAGCGVVAARTGGMPEVLSDGVDAALVAPGDAEALAAAVRGLVDDTPRRRRLGAAAAARATRLNRDEVYRPLEALYQRLGGRSRSASGGRRIAVAEAAVTDQEGDGNRNGKPTRRAVLVCSPGGHLQQMLALKPAWEPFEVSWATLRGHDTEYLLAGQQVAFAHGPTNRSVAKLLRNLLFAHRLLRDRRPDVILSTGAALAVPMFIVGRLHGVRLVYVESLTRTEGLSLSGRLVAPLAHEVFAQWPQAAQHGARYVGSILTEDHSPDPPAPTESVR
jgi:glycosyltransferase involved in cell wall biosynthesis